MPVLGTIVGKAGLEREYDDSLRGGEGVRYIEVNARGRLVREDAGSASLPPTAGRPIQTTIDLDLQRYIDSIWPVGMRGAMIAMTPGGAVRALYSAPTYDPNAFVGGISSRLWQALNEDEARPLLNRAIQTRYPPASPFKLAIGAMALKRGLIRLDTHMPTPCRGGLRLGNRVFRCWKKEGHGSLDLVGAVAASCDVYFYQVGLRLGLNAIIDDGVLMGFRDKSGIDLENEKDPIYPASTAYFDRLYGPRNWSPPATVLNFSIGQGENTQTLINMMKFYDGLAASDGRASVPYVVRPASTDKRDLGLTQAQLAGLRHSLIAVVERGTAAGSRRKDLAVAGKTGTAQNPHGKDHGWFIGFAPADAPELIVGGIMEFGEHGTTVAPYVVKALSRYLLGPDTVGTIKVRVLVDETVAPQDTAPRPIELDPGFRCRRSHRRLPQNGGTRRNEDAEHRSPAPAGKHGAHRVRTPDAVLRRADRRPDPRRGRVGPAVRLGGHRNGRGVDRVPGLAAVARVAGAGPRTASAYCCCFWSSCSEPVPARRREARAGSPSAGSRSASRRSSPRWPRC